MAPSSIRSAFLLIVGIRVGLMVFEVPFIPKHHSPSHLFLRQSSVSIHQQDESFSSQRAEPKSVPVEMSDAIQSSSKAAGGLSCERYGGPRDEFASEMVYWQDTNPSDASFVSPYQKTGPQEKYLTFELFAGWNNIRMVLETTIALAAALGRTLVLPPIQQIYNLDKGQEGQKRHFSLSDFFPIDSLAKTYAGFDVITFEEFLLREVMTGHSTSPQTGQPVFPPGNKTNWDGIDRWTARMVLCNFTRAIGVSTEWDADKCMLTFPLDPSQGKEAMDRLLLVVEQAHRLPHTFSPNAKPSPVNASLVERLVQRLNQKGELCFYTEQQQKAPVIHLRAGDPSMPSGTRLFLPFYSFLFFEDWKQEQWIKRMVRDHLRYVDEIQCAAARVVHAVRLKAEKGVFDSMHVRRTDFSTAFPGTNVEAATIYNSTLDILEKGSVVYIATDEKNKTFYDVFRPHYKIFFLDDFMDEIKNVNTNFYGMLDQLIASRGRVFIGSYYSTFTNYINRMRGYHSQKDKAEGYENGILNSYYYAPLIYKMDMWHFKPLAQSERNFLWTREYPVGWMDQ